MKKKILIPVVFACFTQFANAQAVPKKVVVEHFTNTVCSVCASKNPGFYTNLASQTGVLHLAIHPSAPYSSCLLNKQNIPENDARTNYYGVYGATPRLAIQGTVINGSANYNSASIFTPYLGQTSPLSIHIRQAKYASDSIVSKISIKAVAPHALFNLKLFVALAEDTVFYSSPNGESKHFDVFRKSLSGATGMVVSVPAAVGDSIVYTLRSAAGAAWNFSRIYTLAILQQSSTKEVIQSESVSAKANTPDVATGINKYTTDAFSVTSLIAAGAEKTISIKQNQPGGALAFVLSDISGRVLINKALEAGLETISAAGLAPGIYVYSIKTTNAVLKTGKLLID